MHAHIRWGRSAAPGKANEAALKNWQSDKTILILHFLLQVERNHFKHKNTMGLGLVEWVSAGTKWMKGIETVGKREVNSADLHCRLAPSQRQLLPNYNEKEHRDSRVKSSWRMKWKAIEVWDEDQKYWTYLKSYVSRLIKSSTRVSQSRDTFWKGYMLNANANNWRNISAKTIIVKCTSA